MFEVDINLSKMTNLENLRFEPLTPEEIDLVIRGDFTVALDTEFISIGLGAMEIREDGSREIGKPGDMTVGRVSVVRENGVPFIDHYVAVDETQVKDFVTRFSGIRPGDLDPATSSHWLVSSKALYKKLRFLVDCGCKFVGHGLHTDFRIINLWVPASALIDTVELFHLPSQRFLSLKFLASKLLNRSIQGDVHCSIEDAKTAYELYKVHQRLKNEGTLEQTIKGLYETGRASGWK
jgi:PAB-dependent poly(A)-specific ribonuclease subunit 2